MNDEELKRIRELLDRVNKLNSYEHAEEHFKIYDEIRPFIPKLCDQVDYLSETVYRYEKEIERLKGIEHECRVENLNLKKENQILKVMESTQMAYKQGAKICRLQKALDTCIQQRDEWAKVSTDPDAMQILKEDEMQIDRILEGEE